MVREAVHCIVGARTFVHSLDLVSDIPDQALFIICNLLLIKLEFTCQTKLLNITLPTSKFQLIVPFLKVEYGHMMIPIDVWSQPLERNEMVISQTCDR